MNPAVLESHKSFPGFIVREGKRNGLLDRIPSVWAEVRAGDGAGALLLATSASHFSSLERAGGAVQCPSDRLRR